MTKPTVQSQDENIIPLDKEKPDFPQKSFAENDRFERKQFAEKLTKAIQKFSPFYDDAYVLSLNAPFGSGKSTFIEMWQKMLQTEHGMTCVYLNAWKHDFDDEPIVPILSTLLAAMPANKQKDHKAAFFAAMGSAANDFIAHKTGIDCKKAVDTAHMAGDINIAGQALYQEYHFKKNAFKKLHECLSTYIGELNAKPLVIFVDELDRSRPDYSVRFLETIKHMFPIQGICFVLAVDREQLEKSVAQLYGDIKFEDYYLRFVTNEANLPVLGKVDLQPFLSDLEKEYIDEKEQAGIQFPFDKQEKRYVTNFLADICKGFELKPRQIQKLYRKFSQFMAVEGEPKTASLSWVQASIILIAFSIKSPDMYKKIGLGNVRPREVYEYLLSLPLLDHNNERNDHLVTCRTMSFLINQAKDHQDEIVDICLPYYERHLSQEDSQHQQRRYVLSELITSVDRYGLGGRESAFQEIYKRLEEWSSFL